MSLVSSLRSAVLDSLTIPGLLLLMLVVGLSGQPLSAQETANGSEAGPAKAWKLGILVSSDADRCYKSGLVKAIRSFAEREISQINGNGGIAGRSVELQVFDDYEDKNQTLAHMKTALADPSMIGVVGIGSSTRGHFVFDLLKQQVRDNGMPIVTDISLSQIYAPFPSVFSMANAVNDELDVVRAFLRDRQFVRPAFIGVSGDLYSGSLGNGLAQSDSEPRLALDRRVEINNYAIAPDVADEVVADIKASNADIVFLAIHSGPGSEVVKRLTAAGITVPIFVLYGRSASIIRRAGPLPADIRFFQLGRDGVPYVYNERLRQRIWATGEKAGWTFDDVPNVAYEEGWASGKCKPNPSYAKRQIFDAGNQRAIGRGMQYRDLLHLMAMLAQTAPADGDVTAMRKHVAAGLAGYSEGRRVFKGLWQDWTFTRNRAVAGDILITTSSSDPASAALAPTQYRRVNASLVRSPVIDMSIDLIRLVNVDSNERRFDAEFYISLKSQQADVSINAIDFTNAKRSQLGQNRLLTSRVIHNGAPGSKFPEGVQIYKISGTFQFSPDLATYPFDTQRLSVSFQAKDAAKPILIQPLAQHIRRDGGELDGWVLKDRYVGTEQDIISTIAADGVGRHVVPIYKFNQTWVARRISIDYYIRVVVPLGFILLVTYFSVYLPSSRFDSTVAIQVTALLSSIALYLALPKVESDQATLSDKMFIMTYAAVALMIGLTILKDSKWLKTVPPIRVLVSTIQRVAFPVATVLIVGQLIAIADRDSQSAIDVFRNLWTSTMS